jgi:hypothetical protein
LAVSRLVATLVLSLAAGYLTLALTRSGMIGKVPRRTVAAGTADKCCPAKQRLTPKPEPIPVTAGPVPARPHERKVSQRRNLPAARVAASRMGIPKRRGG